MTTVRALTRATAVLSATPEAGSFATAEWWPHPVGPADPLPASEVTSDFLAAVEDRKHGGCDIADVIVGGLDHRSAGDGTWPERVLRRYPGCAVAAIGLGAAECLVAVRGGCPVKFVIDARTEEPGLHALVCGSVAHGWLCTGRQLAGLESAVLRICVSATGGRWDYPVQSGALSCSLRMTCRPSAEPQPASRSLT